MEALHEVKNEVVVPTVKEDSPSERYSTRQRQLNERLCVTHISQMCYTHSTHESHASSLAYHMHFTHVCVCVGRGKLSY